MKKYSQTPNAIYLREWHKKNPDKSYRTPYRDLPREEKNRNNNRNRERYKLIKIEVLREYSPVKGIIQCSCEGCNITHEDMLTIGHINNDGGDHRRKVGKTSFYGYLRKNNFPHDPPLQTECFNCNLGKEVHGYCPFRYQLHGVFSNLF